jgi:hypothetical protein
MPRNREPQAQRQTRLRVNKAGRDVSHAPYAHHRYPVTDTVYFTRVSICLFQKYFLRRP